MNALNVLFRVDSSLLSVYFLLFSFLPWVKFDKTLSCLCQLQLPVLRKVALDLCDACEGGFVSPSVSKFIMDIKITINFIAYTKDAFLIFLIAAC